MVKDRTLESFTPVEATPQTHNVNVSLSDVADELQHIAKAYDTDFTAFQKDLSHVADTMCAINDHRFEKITQLKENFRNLQMAFEDAQKSAEDTEALQHFRNESALLEQERESLSGQIEAGTGQNEVLEKRLEQVQNQLRDIRIHHDALRNRSNSDLPALKYLKKMYYAISRVTFLSKPGADIIEGFVSKLGENDVVPIEFDNTLPDFSSERYEEVNRAWNIISA